MLRHTQYERIPRALTDFFRVTGITGRNEASRDVRRTYNGRVPTPEAIQMFHAR